MMALTMCGNDMAIGSQEPIVLDPRLNLVNDVLDDTQFVDGFTDVSQ